VEEEMMRRYVLPFVAMTALGLATPACGAEAAEVQSVRAFYFGNSYTGNTMPGLHPLLGKSAGREWTVNALIHPGVPIWLHMYKQTDTESRNYQVFQERGPETDAIVMLCYGGDGLSSVVTEKWQGKVKFKEPTDIGDVAACAHLIERYLRLNPKGRAYVYTAWPGIPGIRDLRDRLREDAMQAAIREGADRKEAREQARKIKPTHEQMEPFRNSFDYAAGWLNDGYIPNFAGERRERFHTYRAALNRARRPRAPGVTVAALAEAAGVEEATVRADLDRVGWGDRPIASAALAETIAGFLRKATMTHCRKHMWGVMDGLIERFPALWKQGRLGMIPVGDVFLEIDRRMRAGKVPGLTNIGAYSADGGHLRAGLPRYTLAATYYAVLFRDHPKQIDYKVFDEIGNYESGKFGFYVHQPDLGVKIDITPERARVVNDCIWEVVRHHPYTAIPKAN
jgi:hypothetical protein